MKKTITIDQDEWDSFVAELSLKNDEETEMTDEEFAWNSVLCMVRTGVDNVLATKHSKTRPKLGVNDVT